MKAYPARLLRSVLLLALGVFALHCVGNNFQELQSSTVGGGGAPGPGGGDPPPVVDRVFGRASLRPAILVEENFRAGVLANRAQLEAEDVEVAEDGSLILFPEAPAAGWRVITDQEQLMTGTDGGFSLAVPTSATGQLLHPTDDRAPAGFDPAVLSADPADPTPIVVIQPFRGPCGMTSPVEDFCMVDSPDDLPGPIVPPAERISTKAVPTKISRGPRGTYPVPLATLHCEDTNGILSGLTSNKHLAYIGSTCDGYVKVGCCPNENPFSDIEYNLLLHAPALVLLEGIRAGNPNVVLTPATLPAGFGTPNLNCVDNHKGRVCQQLLPGDLSVDTGKGIAEAFELELVRVLPGTTYGFIVHNNGCFGTTFILPLAKAINGILAGSGLVNGFLGLPTSQELHDFLSAVSLAPGPAGSVLSPGFLLEHFQTRQGVVTYRPDRLLQFTVPPTATPGQKEAFLFLTDHSPVVLVFEVVASGDDGTGIGDLPLEITRVSVASDGTQADGHSGVAGSFALIRAPGLVSINQLGDAVAFVSMATNLVAQDENGTQDLFQRALASAETTRPAEGGGFNSLNASGQTLAYQVGEMFSPDSDPGVFSTTGGRLSKDENGNPAEGVEPSLSADAQTVAFATADSLVAKDINGRVDVYVNQAGMILRASAPPDGEDVLTLANHPRLSADGKFVVFEGSGLDPSPVDDGQIFLRDLDAGTIENVSLSDDDQPSPSFCGRPDLSGEGQFVVFHTTAGLVPFDQNGTTDVYRRNRLTGETELVSCSAQFVPNNQGEFSDSARISADGRFVVFTSIGSLGLTGPDGVIRHVFLKDMLQDEVVLLSANAEGQLGNADSGPAVISGDGRYVAFPSSATNLVEGDTNQKIDVFLVKNPRLD